MSGTRMGASDAARLYNERHLGDPTWSGTDVFRRWARLRTEYALATGEEKERLYAELTALQEQFYQIAY